MVLFWRNRAFEGAYLQELLGRRGVHPAGHAADDAELPAALRAAVPSHPSERARAALGIR